MILEVLQRVISELNQYIEDQSDSPTPLGDQVVLGNIATAEEVGGPKKNLSNKVVLSLVNLAEEAALKNGPVYRRTNEETEYANPLIHLNLYLLFSANYVDDNDTDNFQYGVALTRLEQVISYLQGKHIYTATNTPSGSGDGLGDFKLIFELFSLTFEQINHLWGSLGGKQVPFVLYKVRQLPVEINRLTGRGGNIEQIQTRTKGTFSS